MKLLWLRCLVLAAALYIVGSSGGTILLVLILLVSPEIYAFANNPDWMRVPFIRSTINGLRTTIATLLGFFFSSRTFNLDAAKLGVIGSIVTTFFLFTSLWNFPGGAIHFFSWAYAIVHGSTLPPQFAQRDVGFPIVVLLSGYTLTGSIIGVAVIHAVFAILMPILIYAALYRLSYDIAYYTAIASIISLEPILFVKWMYHDQTYIFFLLLTAVVLALHIQTRRLSYLYLFTVAMLAASFTRPAGNLVFPVGLAVAYFSVRARLQHYLVCIGIFIVCSAAYAWHRYEIFDMGHQPTMPSYTGEQVFYDLYLNSKEYGIRLSSDLGPNMARITNSMRKLLQPNPRDSKLIHDYLAGDPQQAPAFAESYIFPFTADELMNRTFDIPNAEYYFLLIASEDDQTFLGASWEVFKAHPWYVIRYTLRNAAFFTFRPGYAHTRFNLNPWSPVGLEFFPRSQQLANEPIDKRALREMHFDPLPGQPSIIQRAVAVITEKWTNWYYDVVVLTDILMFIAWAAVGFAMLSKVTAPYKGSTLPAMFEQSGLVGSIITISALLFYNAIITGAFGDPDYRYFHFTVPLRILLSGYGVVVLGWVLSKPPIDLLYRFEDFAAYKRLKEDISALRRSDGFAVVFKERTAHLNYLLAILVLILFTWWMLFTVAHTS
jgi:hypothetical protein